MIGAIQQEPLSEAGVAVLPELARLRCAGFVGRKRAGHMQPQPARIYSETAALMSSSDLRISSIMSRLAGRPLSAPGSAMALVM